MSAQIPGWGTVSGSATSPYSAPKTATGTTGFQTSLDGSGYNSAVATPTAAGPTGSFMGGLIPDQQSLLAWLATPDGQAYQQSTGWSPAPAGATGFQPQQDASGTSNATAAPSTGTLSGTTQLPPSTTAVGWRAPASTTVNTAQLSDDGAIRSGAYPGGPATPDGAQYDAWANYDFGAGLYDQAGAGSVGGPGAYEQWYDDNARQLGLPGSSLQYYRDNSQGFTAPTASEGYYDQTRSAYTAPGASTDYYQQNAENFASPTDMEQWFAQNQGQYGQPTALDAYAQTTTQGPGAVGGYYDANSGTFTGPNALSTWYGQNAGQLGTTDAMSQWWSGAEQSFAQPNALATFAQRNQTALQDPGDMQRWWSQNQDQFGTDAAAEWWGDNAQQFAPQGAAENYWQDNQDAFAQEGSMENFYEGVAGRLGSGPTVTNRAEEEYQRFSAARPDIDYEAGLDPYYDRAEEKTLGALNQQLGARGAYGSSVGLGMLGGASADLRADQANREADYRLRAIGEQRAWDELGGNMARTADVSSADRADADLERTMGFGSMANDAQKMGLSRLLGAAGVASDAQRQGLERLLGAAGVATDVGQLGLDRASTAGSLALGADTAARQRTALAADVADRTATQNLDQLTASGEMADAAAGRNLQRLGLSGQLAGNVGELNLDSLVAGGNLANQVSGQTLARDTLNAGIATDQSRLGLDSLIAESDAARSSADSGLSRLLAGTDAAQAADASQLDRLTAGTDAAYRASTTDLAGRVAGMDAALGADDIDLRRDALGGDLALNAQTAEERRIQQEFANRFGVFNTLAGVAGGTYGGMFDADQELAGAEAGVPLAGATNTANTANANEQFAMSIIPQLFSMIYGGGGITGGAAPTQGA